MGKTFFILRQGPPSSIHLSDDQDGGSTADNTFDFIYFGKYIWNVI